MIVVSHIIVNHEGQIVASYRKIHLAEIDLSHKVFYSIYLIRAVEQFKRASMFLLVKLFLIQ